MKHSFLQLACAAVIGVLAASAQAQRGAPVTPSATPGTSSASSNPADASSPMAPGSITFAPDAALSTPDSDELAKAKAEADLRAAQTACSRKTVTDRDDCMRIAQENYIRALDEGSSMHSVTNPDRPNIPTGASSVPSGTAGTGDITEK